MEEGGERAVDEVNISNVSIVQYFLAIYHKIPHEQSAQCVPKTSSIQQVSHVIHSN